MEKFFSVLRSSPVKRSKGWLGGVCAGIAATYGWDVSLVRIAVLLSFLLPFVGIGTYVVAWLLLPKQDGSILLQRLVSP
ncbi:PspC domain-containing protein [Arthrobacter zhangbolii]|uniref:PspC domain-containing protein n=1 Tax=Arthrobacter zhangbolii TaxID=2886936 RepID=A0A9X1M733_9MICC|nr:MULTISPECIES: PspC domain-containing protein [Arthrobacter]MCC3272673.1 PspC domain-containing protein [Arthrobacter zhangbolii]MDN3903735.1 PspC domain-containing protein [Arthrobacter sp. YD2]UON91486.1 PspC domain-containing protein [Arthrobacter zhangbolii]